MFGFLLKSLLSFLNPLEAITKQITDMKVRLAAEQNHERRIELESELANLETRKQVILAAQSDPMERWVRIGFAAPFILYIWKLVIWDKLLGWGVTDDLSQNLWTILWIVLGGYFIDSAVKRFRR